MLPLTTRPPRLAAETRAAGSSYEITYLDEDMLIGKAQASGGVFIFTRSKDE